MQQTQHLHWITCKMPEIPNILAIDGIYGETTEMCTSGRFGRNLQETVEKLQM